MGADLYRRGYEVHVNRHQPEWDAICAMPVESGTEEERKQRGERLNELYDLMYPASHYFRDSYNNSSLFWQLNLSWWRECENLERDEDDYTPVTFAETLRAKVMAPGQREKLEAIVDDDERAYFLEKYCQFIHFLSASIKAGDPILYSV